ncbi:MAG: hypothetical protein U0325_16390 [Polyangiales bacterium]
MRLLRPACLALVLASANAAAQERPAPATPAPASPRTPAPAADEAPPPFGITIPGDAQLRYSALSNIPLAVTPGNADMAPNLGQNQFFEGWVRLRPSLRFGERLRVHFSFDITRTVLPDNEAQSVPFTRDPRTELLPFGVVDIRTGYFDWDSPVGNFRIGQQAFSWGLGILANDGDTMPVFGDYRMGDLVERISFATRPGGRSSNLVAAVAGDIVYRDRVARLVDGDIALQAVLSVFYQDHACVARCDRRRVGALLSYRDVSFGNGDALGVFVADVLARWEWPTPDRTGRVWAGLELAGIWGSTNAARTQYYDSQSIEQYGAVAELGMEREGKFRVALEGGWASGDRNPVDTSQRRMTFNPSHRVGLVLFPEVIAWQTARSAAIATDPVLAARPSRGAFLLPSSGGVTGAVYLYPTAQVFLGRYVDLRGGLVLAMASSDWVDPVSVQRDGTARNYRGGDPTRRDLGLELDFGVNASVPVRGGVRLEGGLQGGVLFPGRAFADATGALMPPVGMGVARFGIGF